MVRDFRFGVAIPGTLDETWLGHVQRAEELGYDIVLAADHLHQSPPLIALAAAATRTSTIRLGTYVLNNDLRHPAVLAQEVAGLDHLSGGRVELGLGAGWARGEYERAGIAFDPPGRRIERMNEAAGVLRALLRRERDHGRATGPVYDVGSDAVGPPYQDGVPLMIGGSGPRVLSVAARRADIVSFALGTTPDGAIDSSDCTVASLDAKVETVRVAAGDHFAELELNIMVPAVLPTEDPAAAAADHLERLTGGAALREDSRGSTAMVAELTVDDVLASPHFLFGSPSEMADALRSRRERWGITYVSVLLPAMEAMAPVIDELARDA